MILRKKRINDENANYMPVFAGMDGVALPSVYCFNEGIWACAGDSAMLASTNARIIISLPVVLAHRAAHWNSLLRRDAMGFLRQHDVIACIWRANRLPWVRTILETIRVMTGRWIAPCCWRGNHRRSLKHCCSPVLYCCRAIWVITARKKKTNICVIIFLLRIYRRAFHICWKLLRVHYYKL